MHHMRKCMSEGQKSMNSRSIHIERIRFIRMAFDQFEVKMKMNKFSFSICVAARTTIFTNRPKKRLVDDAHTHKRTQKTVSERERRHTHDTFHRKKTRCMRVNLRKKQRQPERECEAIKCVHALVVFALVVDPLCHSSSYSLGFRE